MNLFELASVFEKLAAPNGQVEAANYALILNIYNQIQDLAVLISKIQFSDVVKNNFIKMQNSSFKFAMDAYEKGLTKDQATTHLNNIKSVFQTVRSQVPQNIFKPFDLLDQMIKRYIPSELSAQSKNNGKKPTPLVAITSMTGVGKLPQSVSVQMPTK